MIVWEPVYQAASAVLMNRRCGEVLLVATPYRDGLVLPGGIVEPGESPAGAAEREVREETGLEIRVTRLLALDLALPAAAGPSPSTPPEPS